MRYMNVKKFIPLLIMGMLLTFFSSGLWAQNLEIHYINVQQGQSTLIIGPDGTTILYDGGFEFKGTTEVVPYLQALGIFTSQPLDYIVTSHLHTDHYVGLTETMNYGYDALYVYDNGSDYSNAYVDAFNTAAAGTTAGGVTAMTLGQVIPLGNGATATCVAVDGSVLGVGAVPDGQNNENDRSICLLVEYGDFDFLVTGDVGGGSDDNACTGRSTSQVNIETPLAQAIMPGGANPLLTAYGVEVAHIGHHGSESSGNSDYMNLLTPSVACVSVGDGQSSNWYHPREDVVNVFLAVPSCVTAPAALVLQTEEGNPTGSITSFDGYSVGDIVITTDGVSTYTVSASGAVSQGPDERSSAGLPVTLFLDEYTGGDPAPVISNVHDANVTQTTADILWTTNESADSLVRYGTVSGTYTQTVSDGGMVLGHSLSLSGLTDSTTYYYQVESTDSGSNTTTSAEYYFATGSTGGDSGVVFSEVYYDTVGTDADEEWIEFYNNTASTVDIGGWTITDNNGTGSSYTFPAGTTIAAGTYLTAAADSTGFNALYSFDADLYGSIPLLNNSGDTLILTNGSSEVVDFVAWEGGASSGTPSGWGSTSAPSVSTGNSIARTNPAVDTDTYADWGSISNNGDPQTQATVPPDTTPPVISNVGDSSVTTDSVVIGWDTDEDSDSVVEYGTSSGTYTDSESSGSLVTAHSVTLPGLSAGTTYYYIVKSTDASTNMAVSAEYSFATNPVGGTAGLVFSEIYYDTVGTDADEEWIEFYNNTASTVDIGGWTITDNNGTGSSYTFPVGTTIAADSYFTVAANSVGFNALYGYDADLYGTLPFLNNSGDTLILTDGSAEVVDFAAWEGGASSGIPVDWGSSSAPSVSTGYTIVRTDPSVDTDTYADWGSASNNGDPQTQGVVTPAPTAEFSADVTTVIEGDSVNFTDLSIDSPTSWNWTFVGGTPGSSTVQDPSVVYNTAGTYAVTLEVSNAGGSDTETKLAYITVEPLVTSSLVLESGTVASVGSSWQTVTLGNTYTSMVVVCTTDGGSANLPAVARVRNASGNSFEVLVQNPNGTVLSGYTVHYVVVEEGVYTVANDGVKMEAVKVNSVQTAENNSWVMETRAYSNAYTSPVVVGQVMTYNDVGWSVFWASGSSRTSPPTSSVFSAGKEVGEDPDAVRVDETIGYIVIESGDGIVNGISYSAALGADTVRGPDNSASGYTYTFGSMPTAGVVVLSAAGMDGNNGGWPMLWGGSPLTSTQITMVFTEDQVKDSERKHTTEQVAYIVFSQ